jgi:murein DD-endopeptidase MepM/ murein hydrolase activator NlpD
MNAVHVAPVSFRLEWWHFVLLFFWMFQFTCAVVPRAWPSKAGMIFWYFGSDRLLWLAVASMLFVLALGWSMFYRPFWRKERLFGMGGIILLAVAPLTYRVYPSSNADRISHVRFRIPFDDLVTVGWGGNTNAVNYHVIVPEQRWAYDLLMTDEQGRTHRGDGKQLEDYYIYDKPVLAPADGKVISIFDSDPDMPIGVLGGGSNPGGNFIKIEVAPKEILYLAHLKPGSLLVKPGDLVRAGQELARVGNSGNTSEPHLHIHLMDEWDDGLPLYFYGYRSAGRYIERGMPEGGIRYIDGELKFGGETIHHVSSAVE